VRAIRFGRPLSISDDLGRAAGGGDHQAQDGADPAAVAFDACEAAKARGMDVLIVDTAGRLHTQDHLMRELVKFATWWRADRGSAARGSARPRCHQRPERDPAGENVRTGVAVSGIVPGQARWHGQGRPCDRDSRAAQYSGEIRRLGEKPEDIETFDPIRFIKALFGEDE